MADTEQLVFAFYERSWSRLKPYERGAQEDYVKYMGSMGVEKGVPVFDKLPFAKQEVEVHVSNKERTSKEVCAQINLERPCKIPCDV